MTAQRPLYLGVGVHQLAVNLDDSIPSLETRLGQLATWPGWQAQLEPLTRLQPRLAPMATDRVDAVPRAAAGADATGRADATTRQAALEQVAVDGRCEEVVERAQLASPIGRVGVGEVTHLNLVEQPSGSVERAIGHDRGRGRGGDVLKEGGRWAFAFAGPDRRFHVIKLGSTAVCELLDGVEVVHGEPRHPAERLGSFSIRGTRWLQVLEPLDQESLQHSDPREPFDDRAWDQGVVQARARFAPWSWASRIRGWLTGHDDGINAACLMNTGTTPGS